MPIIEHTDVIMPPVTENRSERTLVSSDAGAVSLTIKEVELHPGYVGRLHTHGVDVAVMVMSGAVQMVVGDDVRTVRAGCHLVSPARNTPQANQHPVDASPAFGYLSLPQSGH